LVFFGICNTDVGIGIGIFKYHDIGIGIAITDPGLVDQSSPNFLGAISNNVKF